MASEPATDVDVMILGQGLAGSSLAWALAERGLSAHVFDRGGVDPAGRPAASRVAAGLITPVTGKRLTVAADFEERFAVARSFYRQVEAETGVAFFDEAPSVRLFAEEDERVRFLQRIERGELSGHARLAEPKELPAGTAAPHGAFVMPQTARLDVRRFLDATRDWLASEGRYAERNVDPRTEVEPIDGAVRVAGVTARWLVLCQGHSTPPLPWLDGVAFAPAKGEVLTIEADTLRDRRVLHRGVWIAPCESGVAGRYRVGSTTEWHRLDSAPTAAAREELLGRLEAAGVTVQSVINHQAAIRPATPDRRPTIGFSAEEPRIGWFNGLGAKGSLWAPSYAAKLADALAQQ